MRFLLYLQNSRHFSPNDIPQIRSIIENRLAESGVADHLVKNIRVSGVEVQLDVFVPGNDSRRVQEEVATSVAKRLEEEIGPLNGRINLTDGLTAGLGETATIIERVIQSFNNERYWEAQETAEAIWNKTKDPHEKNVVQGLILVGAALVHHQRGEDQVCLSILRRALAKLQDFERVSKDRRSFLRMDIEALREDVQKTIAAGKARGLKLQTLK